MASRVAAKIAVISITSAVIVGCATEADEDDVTLSADEELTSAFQIGAGATKTVHLKATATRDVVITLDCGGSPSSPDVQGPVVKISAPSLGVQGTDPARAGYWRHAASVPAGTHDVSLTSVGAGARCTLKTTNVPASATCRAYDEWRSPNTDHTHYRVGSEGAAAGWEPFPASGNHWGAWAMWNTVYPKPIKRGFLLHNLEHGGLVFSYKCNAASDSAACASARDKLVAVAQSIGPRVVVTPDPTQPTMFAVRAWRYAYTSECFDEGSATAFSRAHYAQGREDADSDPPIPFDPTTTDVPCQDLMAAPDSC